MVDMYYLRTLRGMTMQDVADACGVTRQAIYNIEHYRNKPGVELAKKLGDLFGVDWWRFLEMGVVK